jgi:cell division protein ZapA
MCKVRDAGKIKARDRIAVLAALNLAFEQTESASSAETSPAKPPLQEATFNDADNDRLGQLLKKLDQALHKDGQLI